MKLVFITQDGRTEPLELANTMELAEVKSFLEAIFGIPSSDQILQVSNRVLPDAGTIAALGVAENDIITVRSGASAQAQNSSATSASSSHHQTQSVTGGRVKNGPVYWDGMNVDDVMSQNTNPEHIVDIIQSHDNLLRELNFHNSELADHLKKDRATAIRELRTYMMMNATAITIQRMGAEKKDREMEQRLRMNPMDEEANRHFGNKLKDEQIQQSYINMMQNYPEAMTRVLMLYIEVEINGIAVQAFVDSGAQTSVMSARCAEMCNLSRLIDSRFAGQVVGVGTGKTLGRIHLADIKIEGHYFPISLTVMDDANGLGDKNMEFLLGLDMLRRHRCNIDLAQGKLSFYTADTSNVSTPFLHEKDLSISKGGTKQ